MNVDQNFLVKNQLKWKCIIGKGTFGYVHLVYSLRYKLDFALKIVEKAHFNISEVSILSTIDNINIIRLYLYETVGNYVYLLMEYCTSSLSSKIMDGCLTGDKCLKYTQDILHALTECHKMKISHGDIKPNNCMVDDFDRIKLSDFGLSSFHSDDYAYHHSGSFLFMAPEIFSKLPFDPYKTDIWALGVTLYILHCGCHPWKGNTPELIMKSIMNADYIESRITHPIIRQIIASCLNKNPKERPTADQMYKDINSVARKPSRTIVIPKRRIRKEFSTTRLIYKIRTGSETVLPIVNTTNKGSHI